MLTLGKMEACADAAPSLEIHSTMTKPSTMKLVLVVSERAINKLIDLL